MTDEKTGPVCRWCQEPAERHLGKLKLCPTGGALSFHAFTPAKPEAKEAVRSHTEHLVIENWKLYEKAATERDAAIERAEAAEQAGAYLITQQGAHKAVLWDRECLTKRRDELEAQLAAVTAERDEWRQAKGEEIEYSNRLELERDKMRPVIEAARSVVAKLLAEIRREGVTAQWAYKREYVALIGAVDALDAAKPAVPLDIAEQERARLEVDEEVIKESANRMRARMLKWAQDERAARARLMGDPTLYAKPAEPTPAQCSGKCKWDDGAGEGPGYSYGDADCPVHGVERGGAPAVAAEIASWDAERCHCGQHSMERPDIHSINWYWSKHTREACTLELPNVRCWCGRLRSEHIDGHAAPITPPPVDPRDARIAGLEEKLVAADVYGVELIRRIGERDAKIACAIADAWAEWLEYAGVDRGDMPSVTDQRITVDLAKLLNTLEAVTRESPLRKVRS